MEKKVQLYEKETQRSNEQLQMLLNAHPDEADVRVNAKANNSKYLPISTIERKLDEVYAGLWKTENFRWQVVANEIIGSLDLSVYNPVQQVWITRTGAASAMIQTKRGEAPTVENKHMNTLVKDFPHMKSECLKNAAKSLGVVFGRSLNRGTEDTYQYLSDTAASTIEGAKTAYELLEKSTLADDKRSQVRDKINRATPKRMEKIIEFLETKQSQENV